MKGQRLENRRGAVELGRAALPSSPAEPDPCGQRVGQTVRQQLGQRRLKVRARHPLFRAASQRGAGIGQKPQGHRVPRRQ
jgi:hypothetical protein